MTFFLPIYNCGMWQSVIYICWSFEISWQHTFFMNLFKVTYRDVLSKKSHKFQIILSSRNICFLPGIFSWWLLFPALAKLSELDQPHPIVQMIFYQCLISPYYMNCLQFSCLTKDVSLTFICIPYVSQ